MTTLEVTDDDSTRETLDTIDYFLAVIGAIRDTKPRDPLRALEDRMLEMRWGVEASSPQPRSEP